MTLNLKSNVQGEGTTSITVCVCVCVCVCMCVCVTRHMLACDMSHSYV